VLACLSIIILQVLHIIFNRWKWTLLKNYNASYCITLDMHINIS